MKTHTVELFINVTQAGNTFTGEYALRALSAEGVLLYEAQAALPDLVVTTSDYARLLTLQSALERLHIKLCGGKAVYALHMIQSSKNINGWLARGWKRNAEQVRTLAGAVDTLLTAFPRKSFTHVPRAELDALIKPQKEAIAVT